MNSLTPCSSRAWSADLAVLLKLSFPWLTLLSRERWTVLWPCRSLSLTFWKEGDKNAPDFCRCSESQTRNSFGSGYCSVPGMLSSCLPVSIGCFNQGLPHMMWGFPHPHAELRICCISSSGIEKSIYLTEEFHDHFSGRLSALLALLAERFVDSLVLEKDPGPSITVQGRLHCPNSVLYGVSGHTGIYGFPYSHKEEETTFCGLCFCSSACPIQCSGCLTSVRIRILRQEGHRPLLFGVFTTFLGTSRRFCDVVEKHPWCGCGVNKFLPERGRSNQ